MTRKRNQRKVKVQGYDPAAQEHVINSLYPDGRPNIQQLRDMERHMIQPLQDPNCQIPNPDPHDPGLDKHAKMPRDMENEALGFQTMPDRLIDLPPGDAGAGQSAFRRTQIFARLDAPAAGGLPGNVVGNPYDESIGMQTQRSSDCRPRFWHVSFFGIAVQRVANAVPLEPLTQSQILSAQLLPVTTGAVSTPDFVPAISSLKGRVMIHDESGQRFFDVDVLGNRSFDVYAWGVTVFILGPGNFGTPNQEMYEVNRGTGGDLPQQALSGLVEDSIVGARVVPIAVNSTQNVEQRTITAVTDDASLTRVPIPPGSKKVQIISHETAAAAALYLIQFDAGDDGTYVGRSDLGVIDINAGETKSDVILIPNAVQILFTPLLGAPLSAGWSLIFTVESQ